MNVQFTGKIIAAEPLQQGTSQQGNQWCAQNFVIEELNQQYPSRAVFQVYGSDKLQQFGIQVGEVLTAHLGFKARQSSKDGRWFNQLDCWKVERFGTAQPTPQQGMNMPTPNVPPQQNMQQTNAGMQYPNSQAGYETIPQQGNPDNLPF